MHKIFSIIKQRIVDWCLQKTDITVEQLYNQSAARPVQIPGPTGALKFIGEGSTARLVQTPAGWSPIKRVLKTVEYQAWELSVAGLDALIAADEHIIMTARGQVWMKDLVVGELIHTQHGLQPVESIKQLDSAQQMFDLELDDLEHVFYTNGILSHNTTVAAMYILWLATFRKNSRCIIASKAMNHAVEIQSRIKFGYEELPHWLKAGCKFYNRTSIEFDNHSVIICEATSEKTGRGGSPTILFLDEIAFISKRIQDEMWGSIAPSLATGGKLVITSTPNGDSDLFAQLWRDAMAGINTFKPLQFLWWMNPNFDQKYYDEMLGKLGAVRCLQELDCQFLSSDALLINSIRLNSLRWKEPLWKSMGFSFWVPEEDLGGRNKIYLVSMDPATGGGGDYSVIEIFEFPGMTQVAEYRTNDVNIPMLYSKLSWILKQLTELKSNGRAEVLWTFERNGIGEAVSALYYNDENQVEEAELVSDHPAKFGVFTTGRQKILAALQLKSIVEKVSEGAIEINSALLVHELKHFVSKGGSYAAKAGSTDDCVMATLGIMRLLKRLSEYNEDAFKRVHQYVDPDAPMDDSDDPMPFLIY